MRLIYDICIALLIVVLGVSLWSVQVQVDELKNGPEQVQQEEISAAEKGEIDLSPFEGRLVDLEGKVDGFTKALTTQGEAIVAIQKALSAVIGK